MAKYRKKPVVIDAEQWPGHGTREGDPNPNVRYYRTPFDPGERQCEHCSVSMNDHGWIDTLEGGHIVCPGDWVITGVAGEMYPCKDAIFQRTYEPAE